MADPLETARFDEAYRTLKSTVQALDELPPEAIDNALELAAVAVQAHATAKARLDACRAQFQTLFQEGEQ